MAMRIVLGETRFGLLVPIGDLGTDKHGNRQWLCRCDCGKEKKVSQCCLKQGQAKSCGCMKGEWIRRARYKHGGTPRGGRTAEYHIWGGMTGRCHNPDNQRFSLYGARGIQVCDRWRGENGFANFLSDMGKRPGKGFSIERIDNDRGYGPDNCRWATHREQMNNTRRNKKLEWNGVTRTYSQWERQLGLCHGTVHRRVSAGWNVERILTTPHGRKRAFAS